MIRLFKCQIMSKFSNNANKGFKINKNGTQGQKNCENWQQNNLKNLILLQNNLENEIFTSQNDTPGFSHAENGENDNFEHIESDF